MASVSDPSQPGTPSEDPGLPPVSPPSGRFIIQLFVVPGLIVLCLIGLLLGVNYFFTSSRTAEEYLEQLDDPNHDVRWRALNDLAQTLPRDETLAANPDFALEITRRLERLYEESREPEARFLERLPKLSDEDKVKERASLAQNREYTSMYIGLVKHFMIPVAVPILEKIVLDDRKMEVVASSQHRRQAMLALAGLGHKLQRFDALATPYKEEIIAKLGNASKRTGVSLWAIDTRRYLEARMRKEQGVLGLDELFEKAYKSEDPVLRYMAAYAARFWFGSKEDNSKIESLLVRMTNDGGRGENMPEKYSQPGSPEAIEVLKKPGYIVHANAVHSLASRGSEHTPIEALKNMLDEKFLSEMIKVRQPNGNIVTNEGKVKMLIYTTLIQISHLRERNPKVDVSSLRPLVRKLTAYPNATVAQQAKETLAKF